MWDATWPNDHFLRELQVRFTRIATTHLSPWSPARNEVLTYPAAPSAQLFERELGLGLAQTDVLAKVRATSLSRPPHPHPHPATPHLTSTHIPYPRQVCVVIAR